jgi:DNA-binding CsgD family transcriptional regulator
MTVLPTQRTAGPRPRATTISRTVAVRQILVDHLVGLGRNAEFLHVIPTILAALGPHLDPTPFGAPTKVLVNGQPADTPRGDGPLSLREVQVLQLVASGQTNRDIASRLFISENTVKTHLQKIFERLDTRDRAETVAVALRRGIIR